MDQTQITFLIGVGSVIVAVIGWIIKKAIPAIRKVSRFIDRVSGVPADPDHGQLEVVGLFARMDHQDAALQEQDKKLEEQSVVLETIRHEVEFNNGSSVKDAVTRIENHLSLTPVPVPTTTINVNGGQQ